MKLLFVSPQNRTIRTQGFSLIEMLVYMAVLILAISASVNIFLSLNTVLVRNATERALTHSASVTLERIIRDLRSADIVDLTPSIFDVSPGVLTLIQGATTTVYTLDAGVVIATVNGTPFGLLTGEGVVADSLIFTRYTTGDTELIRVALTLSTHAKAASSTRTFYTSGVLRGSYE